MTNRIVLLLLLGTGSACVTELNLDELSAVSCSSDAECVVGICDVVSSLCRDPSELALAPELASPAASATVYTETVLLSWQFRGEIEGSLLIGTDPRLSSLVDGFPLPVMSEDYEFSPPTDATYYWAVESQEQRSAIRSFDSLSRAVHVRCSDENCINSGNGSAQAPFPTISVALTVAEEFQISTIRVAPREGGRAYDESLFVTSPVAIRGGFAPDFSERDPTRFETTVGSLNSPTLVIENAQEVEISGLRVSPAPGITPAVEIQRSTGLVFEDVTFSPMSGVVEGGSATIAADSSAIRLRRVVLPVRATSTNPRALGIQTDGTEIDISELEMTMEATAETRAFGIDMTFSTIAQERGGTISSLKLDRSTLTGNAEANPLQFQAVDVSRTSVEVVNTSFRGVFNSAIVLSEAYGVIENNTIDLFGGDRLSGISASSPNAQLPEGERLTIQNNLIRLNSTSLGSDVTWRTEAPAAVGLIVRRNRPAVFVLHNTVVAYGEGSGPRYALALGYGSNDWPTGNIVNNLLVSAGGDENTAVVIETRRNSDPETLLNNVLLTDDAVAYADEAQDWRCLGEVDVGIAGTSCDLDADSISATDGTELDQPDLCTTEECPLSQVSGNVVRLLPNWRDVFVDVDRPELREGLRPSVAAEAEPIRTGGRVPPATCGPTNAPIECRLPVTEANGVDFASPRAVGALNP